jgi:hypothetical protein
MGECFSEPDSDASIDEVVETALDASPEVMIRQEAEQDCCVGPLGAGCP